MKHPIAKYLMCSYAYYKQDDPLISDEEFDELAKYLLANWDNIEHQHKWYVRKGDLKAGTFLGRYPTMIPGAVQSYRESLKK